MNQMLLPGVNLEPTKKKHKIKPGAKFNNLTVICAHKKENSRHVIYKCKCDCGNITYVRNTNLKSDHIKSCGCIGLEVKKDNGISKTYDLTGRKFGSLVAIRENGKNKKGELYWLFRCELCGRELSFLGRWVRNKPDQKRCDCGEKERKMLESKGCVKRRPRNNEQFAWDIYNVYIKEGWSVRDAATEEGYKRGSDLTRLLMEYIPEYRKRSIERRKNSKDNEVNRRARKLSKIYNYESDFQAACAGILRDGGFFVQTNVRELTGYEIDILVNGYCLELKTRVAKKDIYRAMGQLQINASKSNLKPGLVVPSDVEIDKGLVREMKDQGVTVMTEKSLVVSIT